ncbi:MAG: DNA primase [Streptosporangiales bacterium]|nr:DNA primase [Streptosporangiales bacterium]
MAGRIRDEDIALVRERSPIDEVVREHVALRNAGAGSLKGICPFHDEKTPSFHVSPQRGVYFCFGCQEGGDVITFIRKVEHLDFAEAVERLARRAGVDLRYEQGGAAPNREQGKRTRLVQAHAAAAEFYAEQLSGAEAVQARTFLGERGFEREVAERFGVGYAPRSWDALVAHLRGRGFTDEEMVTGGLARQGQRGLIDRFVGRLLWPIRDLGGDVVGFGARRIYDDDRIEAKYLNTPESPIYKKSHLLYGVDLAKRDIAKEQRAVLVEGYTDVMACHLSGVPTAVATCGTSFGADHIKVLRRLLMDSDAYRGEIIFTFDGDEAGRKAALRAFELDEEFVTQTFVAVQRDGLDPCDLRLQQGDAAVRELVARRLPLFEFAIRNVVDRHDVATEEGRLHAVDEAAPIIARIRDTGLRQRYAINLDRWLGLLDEKFVLQRVTDAANRARSKQRPGDQQPQGGGNGKPSAPVLPDPRDPALQVQRQALKLAVQRPALAGPLFDQLPHDVFTHPGYVAVRETIAAAGGVATAPGGSAWLRSLTETTDDDRVRTLLTQLGVEPLETDRDEPDDRYVAAVLSRLQEIAVTRQVTALKSQLQRVNPVERPEDFNKMFGELVGLERRRAALRESLGGS